MWVRVSVRGIVGALVCVCGLVRVCGCVHVCICVCGACVGLRLCV